MQQISFYIIEKIKKYRKCPALDLWAYVCVRMCRCVDGCVCVCVCVCVCSPVSWSAGDNKGDSKSEKGDLVSPRMNKVTLTLHRTHTHTHTYTHTHTHHHIHKHTHIHSNTHTRTTHTYVCSQTDPAYPISTKDFLTHLDIHKHNWDIDFWPQYPSPAWMNRYTQLRLIALLTNCHDWPYQLVLYRESIVKIWNKFDYTLYFDYNI